jgi:hypothetical protein
MPTLVIENVPPRLFDQIQRRAVAQKRTPSDTLLEVLETAFRTTTPALSSAPLPNEPFLTEEISAPFDIPRPEGKPTRAIRVEPPLPEPHDFPEQE